MTSECLEKCFWNKTLLTFRGAANHHSYISAAQTDAQMLFESLSGGCLAVAINVTLKNIMASYISHLSPAESVIWEKCRRDLFIKGRKKKNKKKKKSRQNEIKSEYIMIIAAGCLLETLHDFFMQSVCKDCIKCWLQFRDVLFLVCAINDSLVQSDWKVHIKMNVKKKDKRMMEQRVQAPEQWTIRVNTFEKRNRCCGLCCSDKIKNESQNDWWVC